MFYAKWTETASNVKVTGKVISFGNDTDNVTIQIIAQGESKAAYEVIAHSNSAYYTIDNVEAGTYIMKVMKRNHATRETTITVADSNMTRDVKIHIYGDVNGDGTITSTDNVKINRHIKNTAPLTGYEFICADVNGDGKVTSSDSVRMMRHIKDILSLFS